MTIEDKRMGIHHAIRLNNALLERGHQHQRFNRRPRLESIADGAIAKIIQLRVIAIVGLKSG
jgi:hypothetical protein